MIKKIKRKIWNSGQIDFGVGVDAKDLEKAVQRDTTERIESTKRLDPQNLDKIQKGCEGIGCTNKEYDNFLKNILSGK